MAAAASRARGSRPSRTAATIPARAARASAGISTTSTPAFTARAAAFADPYLFDTAPIDSASVITTPRKPSSPRSRPVTTLRDREAGTCGSTARTSRWPTITAEAPASMPNRNGTSAVRRSSGSDVRSTGSAWWLSTVTEPWPGKCLRVPITPASANPAWAATTWTAASRGKPDAEPGPDDRVGRAARHVRHGREHRGEAETTHLACVRRRHLTGQPEVAGRARGHEGREAGGRVADPYDRATLLVDADEGWGSRAPARPAAPTS